MIPVLEDVALNLLHYGARMYDAVLGRWHGLDPLAKKYESFSPYEYSLNSPINFIDPFGLDVINKDKAKKDDAEKKKLEAEQKRNAYKGDSKREIRKLDRAVRRTTRDYNSANRLFINTEQAISDLKRYNGELFDKLNNLEDPGGQCVDVYIETVDDLIYGYFGEKDVPQGDNAKPLSGGTQTNKLKYEENGSYYSIQSMNGPNTVEIALDSRLVDPGFILSHEGGHTTYNVAFLRYYITVWMVLHPQKEIGDVDGDPSYEEAKKQERIYSKNRRGK